MPAATGFMAMRIESASAPPLYWAWICSSAGVAVVSVKKTESAFTESMMPYCGWNQPWLWQTPVAGTSSKQKSGTLLGCVTLPYWSRACVTNTPFRPLDANVTVLLSTGSTLPAVSNGWTWKFRLVGSVGSGWRNAAHVTGEPMSPATVACTNCVLATVLVTHTPPARPPASVGSPGSLKTPLEVPQPMTVPATPRPSASRTRARIESGSPTVELIAAVRTVSVVGVSCAAGPTAKWGTGRTSKSTREEANAARPSESLPANPEYKAAASPHQLPMASSSAVPVSAVSMICPL